MNLRHLHPALIGIVGLLTSLTTFADPLPATNFPKLVDGIHRAMADQLFSPSALGADAGADFFTRLDSLARTATDDEAFTAGFKEAATLLPFSHVELRRSATPLPEQLTYLDQMRTGPKSVQLRAEDGIAVLRVRSNSACRRDAKSSHAAVTTLRAA